MSKRFAGSLCLLVLSLPAAVLAEDPAPTPCAVAGPQSPRDIGNEIGINPVTFSVAPPVGEMHLCNVHTHKFAEHKAAGYPIEVSRDSGYACEGTAPPAGDYPGGLDCASVGAGDTVEFHWVYTTCPVAEGPSLGSCSSNDCQNPQLRVATRVFRLTGDDETDAFDYADFADGRHLPSTRGDVEYLGSTTGSSFNDEVCSPLQVTFNVSPACYALSLATFQTWCTSTVSTEPVQAVRPLVTSPRLLSRIE